MSAGNKSVAIRSLVAFAAKTGSLDRRFTPAPSAQEGIEGHKKITSKRPKEYQSEISLSTTFQGIVFRGRADGFDPSNGCLEEIKTFYGDVNQIRDNHRALHWAQAKCYGWLYCRQHQRSHINLALVYFELNTEEEYPLEISCEALELQEFFEQLAHIYCAWQKILNERQALLQLWLNDLAFPFGALHGPQRHMAEAVYKAAKTGQRLMVEAPTGTGKTLGALFPALKAMQHTPVDKIFYLTAKSTGKQLALDTLQLLNNAQPHSPLRVLELTAQEKSCLVPGSECRGDSCPYALDFYTKLSAARAAAAQIPLLNKSALAELAAEFLICPFYLSMEMARWVDVVVADVNYYFDGTPQLLGLSQEFNWQAYLLVDESHNLIERGRLMYTAQLNRADVLRAKKAAPKALKKSIEKINKVFLTLNKTLPQCDEAFIQLDGAPPKLPQALEDFTQAFLDFVQHNPQHEILNGPVQQLFFAALAYGRVAPLVDDDFSVDLQNNENTQIITLRNLNPAKQLALRHQQAHCACFFSATLHPADYYQHLLGLPEETQKIQVPSPFNSRQLQVHISQTLSTRFKDRTSAIAPMCAIIARQLVQTPGNALVFFPSYEFMHLVLPYLQQHTQELNIQLLVQARTMSEAARDEFIGQFTAHRNILGLVVLGGVFSEGVDLPGAALKGAFIATLGLPQVNPINEHMREKMQAKFRQGYDYTYTYPGLQKVIQAAGRVIRTPTDEGYIWLLDNRFAQAKIKQLLPQWWFA